MSDEATYPPMTETLADGSRVALPQERSMTPQERASQVVERFSYHARSMPITLALPRLSNLVAEAITEAVIDESRELALRITFAEHELAQWRAGGVTEELLRRNDGCINVGRGCALVSAQEWDRLTAIAREKGAV